jgi:SWI/SNF-related matrix-associated actin-dependent regulator 1 of chromatin subfamily A
VSTPLYLAEPDCSGYTYGKLTYVPGKETWIIEAEPAVLEMAKRVFKGCRSFGQDGIRFPDTKRSAADLNWLMLRFPLVIESKDQFKVARDKAIAHAKRRDNLLVLPPTTPPPTFIGQLLPFQADGVSFLVANERALLADDMGLGKTISGLASLATTSAFPALLVVPTNVQLQWRRQAGTFLDLPTNGQQAFDLTAEDRGKRLCHIIKGRTPYKLPDVPIYIIHYGLIADWYKPLAELDLKAILFDEIQELRRTGTQKYTGASDLSSGVRYVWGLSGTPIYNYGGEIWSITNILEYHALGDEESFSKEWCIGYGEKVVAKPQVLGDYLKREGLMIRRTKAEVQNELPPKRRVVHIVNHDEYRYNALITQAVRLARGYGDIKEWHEKGQAKRLIENETRRATGVAKAPFVASFVKTLLEAGERVLLYAYHHDVHDTLTETLREFKPVKISGRESQAEKDMAVAAFENGKTNLVQLSLRSTAGLDRLQGRGSCVVFAELDWSPAVLSQCEDRLHRLGIDKSLESILCYYMVTDTGMDETMQEALGLKVGQFVGIMGDKAATEEDKVLSEQAAERHMDRVIEKLKQMKG